jgi:hypothetical protein
MNKFFAVILSFVLIVAPVTSARAMGVMGPIANQILGLGTATVGSTIILNCLAPKSPSIYVFMAGAVAYIAAELLGGQQQKKHHADQEKKVAEVQKNMVNGGDLQKAALEAKLKEEKDQLDFVQKRKMWMMAVSAAFGIATALALAEGASVWGLTPEGCAPTPQGIGAASATKLAIIAGYSFLSVKAGGTGMLGSAAAVGIAGALVYFDLVIPGLLTKITTAMNNAYSRAAIFGGATAIAGYVLMDLMNSEKKLKDNIKKMELLLADFNKATLDKNSLGETGGASSGSTSGVTSGATSGSKNGDITRLAEGIKPEVKSCVSTSGAGIVFSPQGCQRPLKINRPTFGANFGTDYLRSQSNLATDFANALNAGDTAQADLLAGQLANGAARIEKEKLAALEAINKQRAAQKKRPLNFDQEVQRTLASMQNGANRALGTKGASLADLDKNSGGAAVSETKPTEEATAPVAESGADAEAMPSADGDSSASATEGPAVAATEGPAPTLEESLDNYEASEQDISKDRETSIFEQISVRYILNYTRFFKAKEALAPEKSNN